MIGTIRKHQKWLWYLIIGVTIVTFVGFLSPSAGQRGYGNGSDVDFGSIDGAPITRQAFIEARAEERIDFRLRYNQWPPENDEQLSRMGYNLTSKTYQRLFLNAKAAELKIDVSKDAVVRKIKQMFGLKPEQFLPAEKLEEFEKKELHPNNVTLLDFQRFARNRVAHEQLIAVYGMTGQLITPKEAESFYVRENEPMTVSAVFFPHSNYLAQVQADESTLRGYYQSNQAAYRLPEKVSVEYVLFNSTNFHEEVLKNYTNLDQIVSSVYKERGPASFEDKSGKQMTEPDAKALIRKEIIDAGSLTLARRKAANFLNELDTQCSNTNAFSLAMFEALAKAQKATVHSTEPFEAAEGPSLKVTSEFVKAAFALTDTPKQSADTTEEDKSKRSLFYRRPISGEDGAYAIALKQRIPSRVQAFTEVIDQVRHDYTRAQAIELALSAGEKFGAAVTNGMASGKQFSDICAAAKVKAIELPPFSMATTTLSNVDKTTLQELQKVSSELPTGKASGFNQQLDGGFVVYVKSRGKVDEELKKTELPAFVEQMRANRRLAAFNEWFSKHYNETVRRPLEKTQGEKGDS
jgi:peptidyl-prolyl cis-trans isomerase D